MDEGFEEFESSDHDGAEEGGFWSTDPYWKLAGIAFTGVMIFLLRELIIDFMKVYWPVIFGGGVLISLVWFTRHVWEEWGNGPFLLMLGVSIVGAGAAFGHILTPDDNGWLRGSWPIAILVAIWAFAWRWWHKESKLDKLLAFVIFALPLAIGYIYGPGNTWEAYRAHASANPIPEVDMGEVSVEEGTRLVRQSPASGECAAHETIHVVKRGEMLSTIAPKYGVSWRALHRHNHKRQVNPLPADPGQLEIGDILCVP